MLSAHVIATGRLEAVGYGSHSIVGTQKWSVVNIFGGWDAQGTTAETTHSGICRSATDNAIGWWPGGRDYARCSHHVLYSFEGHLLPSK